MNRARKIRNETNKFVKQVKQNYILKLIEENLKEPKKFWKEINTIIAGRNR